MKPGTQPHSIYIHIPFCAKRCSYCDFNTYAGMESLIPAYVDALCSEIQQVAEAADGETPVHTIFFGGGTPSLLETEQVERILAEIHAGFHLNTDLELTLEANPGTVTLEKLRELHDLGVNRLSFGMQTANPAELALLGRIHDHYDVIHAVQWARQAGFDNLSLDLIFGLPRQSLDGWRSSLESALHLRPEHISLYSLIVEPGTRMRNWVQRGLVETPDDDTAAELYEWAGERMEAAGFSQYEISNWASTNAGGCLLSSRHNLQYWRNQPYFGFGAGAHGFVNGVRTANVTGIQTYVRRMKDGIMGDFPVGAAAETFTRIDVEEEMRETLMVGLRMTLEGVSRRSFASRFGIDLDVVFAKEISRLVKNDLLEWTGEDGDILRLTGRGILLGNQVFMQFVA